MYKICYDNTTEEKEMRDRFFKVPEYFYGKCLMISGNVAVNNPLAVL